MSRSMWASTNSRTPRGADRATNDQPSGHHAPGLLTAAASSAKKCLKLLLAACLVALFATPNMALAATSHAGKQHHLNRSGRVSATRTVVLAYGAGYQSPGGSERVRALQRDLARAGFSPGRVDGRYGPFTQAAVMRFQTTRHLIVDGVAGPVTLGMLRHPGLVLYPGSGYGGHGSRQVRALQRSLAREGFSPGRVDGRYGPRTERAVARYQAAHGLTVDGIAGPITLARLSHGHKNPTTGGKLAHTPATGGSHKPAPHKPSTAPQPASPSTGGSAASSSTSPWLIVLIVALTLLLGLSAIWLVRRRHRDDADPAPATDHPVGPVPTNEQEVLKEAHEEPSDRPDEPDEVLTHERVSDPYPGEGEPEPAASRNHVPASNEHAQVTESAAAREPDTAGVGVLEPVGDADRVFEQGLRSEERGDLAGAVGAYQRADALGHAPAATNLGLLLEQQGDLQAARAAYERADGRSEAHGSFNLAVLLEEQGELQAAKMAYQRADRLGHSAAATNLGVLLEQVGDQEAAEVCYRRADQRGDAHGAFNLAVLLEEKGDQFGALKAYRRANHRGNSEIARLARAAALELTQGAHLRATAKKGGERNGH